MEKEEGMCEMEGGVALRTNGSHLMESAVVFFLFLHVVAINQNHLAAVVLRHRVGSGFTVEKSLVVTRKEFVVVTFGSLQGKVIGIRFLVASGKWPQAEKAKHGEVLRLQVGYHRDDVFHCFCGVISDVQRR